MKKNLTLALDADLLRAARKVALERDTSVNQLVREQLAQLVQHGGNRSDRRKTQPAPARPKRWLEGVMELRGMGKEIWKDEDPDEYVRKLREGWD